MVWSRGERGSKRGKDGRSASEITEGKKVERISSRRQWSGKGGEEGSTWVRAARHVTGVKVPAE